MNPEACGTFSNYNHKTRAIHHVSTRKQEKYIPYNLTPRSMADFQELRKRVVWIAANVLPGGKKWKGKQGY